LRQYFANQNVKRLYLGSAPIDSGQQSSLGFIPDRASLNRSFGLFKGVEKYRQFSFDMLECFGNLCCGGLELVETTQDFRAKVDKLNDAGYNANDSESFCHHAVKSFPCGRYVA
jgi:hypothetical protein